MKATNEKIKVGQVGFGVVNDYPPARWKYVGLVNGTPMLEQVKPASQSTAFPPQGVDWATVERIMTT